MESLTFRLEKVVRDRNNEYEDFVGPLDLILHLLSKNKVEIKDIRISDICDQYVSYIERIKRMDIEIASEFTAMASHLVYIKTRMLLSIEDREAEEEMNRLIASLEEHRRQEDYMRVERAVTLLRPKYEEIGRNLITKPPEILKKDKQYSYSHTVDDIILAMRDIFERGRRKAPPPVTAFEGIVGRETYPVSEKVTQILFRIIKNGAARLKALFLGAKSRSEVVATFLAVLEMCRNREIEIAEVDKNDYDIVRREDETENAERQDD